MQNLSQITILTRKAVCGESRTHGLEAGKDS